MPVAANKWGLHFREYISEIFEPRPCNIAKLEDGEPDPDSGYETMLANIEAAISRCDPRVDRFKFKAFEFGKIVDLLGYYITISRSKAFGHYWGYVCIRYLIHLTCLTILVETGLVDEVVDSLDSGATWGDMSQAVAFMAMNTVGQAVNSKSLEEFDSVFTNFKKNPEYEKHVSLTLSVIWADRDSYITLCGRGLLPGCALLLLAALKLLPLGSHQDKNRLYLHDLSFRLFLVGSHRDRQTLQIIRWACNEDGIPWLTNVDCFVDMADSDVIIRAYHGLLVLWKRGSSAMKPLSVELLADVVYFVQQMTGPNPPRTYDELVDILSTSFGILWLVLEHRRPIPASENTSIRRLGITCYAFVRVLYQGFVPSPERQRKLAQLLADVDIVALNGQILLLIISESYDLKDPRMIDRMLGQLQILGQALKKSEQVAPELFEGSDIEWIKTMDYLVGHTVINPGVLDNSLVVDYWDRSFDTWDTFGGWLRRDDIRLWWKCAYPRCFNRLTHEEAIKPRYVCGRCGTNSYCGSTCYASHWSLDTSESHRIECNPRI